MASIQASIQINDGMSPALKGMYTVINTVVQSFTALQAATANSVDDSAARAYMDVMGNVANTIAAVEASAWNTGAAVQSMGQELQQVGQGSSFAASLSAAETNAQGVATSMRAVGQEMQQAGNKSGIAASLTVAEKSAQGVTTAMQGVGKGIQQANNAQNQLTQGIQNSAKALAGTEKNARNVSASLAGAEKNARSVGTAMTIAKKNTQNIDSAVKSVEKGIQQVDQAQNRFNQAIGNGADALVDVKTNAQGVGTALTAAEKNAQGVSAAIRGTAQGAREADAAQAHFNQEIRNGAAAADTLNGKFKALVATVGGLFTIGKIKNWIQDSLGLYDAAKNTEKQLRVVLANVGAAEGAYDALKRKADTVQKQTLYANNAMMAGAAEFATYIKDAKAIESMMDTLANYAAGMSGGGEVNAKQMTDYATQLGKALDGTFDGLKKKGFELSEAQKKIIENGTDMQKALVIDEVISQSWANLATQMANTPAGRITQLKNEFSGMTEEVGARVYPAVMLLFDTIGMNMPQIQGLMYGFADVCALVVVAISGIMDAAFAVYQFFVDNWSWIAPIVWGIVAAMTAYKIVSIIVSAVTAAHTMAETAKAAATALSTGATFAATAAQYGLNAALMACPLTWIVLGIIAIIVAIYMIVGAINKWMGTTISATGVIVGAFFWAGALIYDMFLGLLDLVLGIVNAMVNPFIQFANFLFNVFKNPISSIIRLFEGLADNVLGILSSIARAIDSIFGSNLAGAVTGWRDGLHGLADNLVAKYAPNENYKAVMDNLNLSSGSLGLKRLELKEAYYSGYKVGENIDAGIANALNFDNILGPLQAGFDAQYGAGANGGIPSYTPGAYSADALGGKGAGDKLDGIKKGTGSTADNTAKMADKLDKGIEELKYLRDIAERDAVNRFTTSQINLNMNNENHISSRLDIDGVVNRFAQVLRETADNAAEGVYA